MGFLELEFSLLYFLQEMHNPILDWVMAAITSLGDHGWFFLFLGILLLWVKKTRRIGFAILLSLIAGGIAGNMILKPLFMRDRPCWLDQAVPLLIQNPKDYSFPSGHTLAAFETAVSVFLYDKRWGTGLLLLAFLIALSRLYLFVHFPTDVLSGMALGIFIAWYIHRSIEKYKIYDILNSTIKKNAE